MYDTLIRETTSKCPLVSAIAQRVDSIPIYISQEASLGLRPSGILRGGWIRLGGSGRDGFECFPRITP